MSISLRSQSYALEFSCDQPSLDTVENDLEFDQNSL